MTISQPIFERRFAKMTLLSVKPRELVLDFVSTNYTKLDVSVAVK